jgi:hypothetical protein
LSRRSGTRFSPSVVAADAFIIIAGIQRMRFRSAQNSIDWASRFRPQPFNGKQAFLLSASPR